MTYTTLISAGVLLAVRRQDLVIVDCRFALADPSLGQTQYVRAHLPNARYAHLDKHLSSPITQATGRHPLPEFSAFIDQVNNWGIKAQTQVVAYDDAGGAFASRLWWLLKTCGHEAVAVLNGGIKAWMESGGELSTEEPEISLVQTPYIMQPDRRMWLEVEAIQANLDTQEFVLIDARTQDRYNGDAEPIDDIAGRIPHALNLPVPQNVENDFFKSRQTIRENFLAAVPESSLKSAVHYCGSGVYACHNILSMEYAGLGRARLYPGSWSEWIRDGGRPKAGSQF